ncbi:type II secretion system F family protein [Streptomyces varsoviensis]|uniref:Membrane protein n=1 Tax=Streptomyces varsoviensis TaxID=67373 RepID=A0ABR5J9M0_9ACTN|nr:type II secretion system F family protein [Streptomyces varsoviensis]KOG90072.1 membrane protein [Streptomyces varsoviensis]
MTGMVTTPEAVPVCAAALCAGAALWWSAGRADGARRARLLLAGGPATAPVAGAVPPWVDEWLTRLRRLWRTRREAVCVPIGCVVALLGASLLPLLIAVAAMPLVRRWLRARRLGRERERREAAVIEFCGVLAGELRAGRQPAEVLAGLAQPDLGPSWPEVAAAARFGGDVPGALRAVGRQPGAEGLNGVAACWRVAVDGGAGLADGLERVAGALRADRDQREELYAQLAGTRTTAVMLALLPVFGLLMGSALGASPLWVLLHSPAGLGALAVGGLLECAGLWWTARIVRAARGISGEARA